jgi:hypothetical protein
MNMDEITGGSPYGAGTLAGSDGNRVATENELEIARYQGRHVAAIAKKLVTGASSCRKSSVKKEPCYVEPCNDESAQE